MLQSGLQKATRLLLLVHPQSMETASDCCVFLGGLRPVEAVHGVYRTLLTQVHSAPRESAYDYNIR